MMRSMKALAVFFTAVTILTMGACKQNSASENGNKAQKITVSEPKYDSLDEYKKPQEKVEETVSEPETAQETKPEQTTDEQSTTYCANINTKKFHLSSCNSVKQMKPDNMYKTNNRQELIDAGYKPCANCNP